MARKVFKYGPLEIKDDVQLIHLPVSAKIVHVGSQSNGYISIWAIVDEDSTEVTSVKQFQIFGTGHPIPEDAQYVGTSIQGTPVTLQNGSLVWHVFERLAD